MHENESREKVKVLSGDRCYREELKVKEFGGKEDPSLDYTCT